MTGSRIWFTAALALVLALVVGAGGLLPQSWPEWVSRVVVVVGLAAGVALPLTAKVLEREAASRSASALPPGVFLRRIADISELGVLGIRPAREPYTGDGDGVGRTPAYIERSADAELREKLGRYPFLLLVGRPKAGKSRSLFEALRVRPWKRYSLVVPSGREDLAAAARYAAAKRRSVLWLDDLPRFLEDGKLPAGALHTMIAEGRAPRVVATSSTYLEEESGRWLRPEHPDNIDVKVLQLPVDNPPVDEREAQRLGRLDGRLADALRQWAAHRIDIARYLAAGTEAVEEWESLRSEEDQRVAVLVQAACDLRRMGMTGPLPVDAVELVYRCHRGGAWSEEREDLPGLWRLAGLDRRTRSDADARPDGLLTLLPDDPDRCVVREDLVDEIQRNPDLSAGRPLPEVTAFLLQHAETGTEVLTAVMHEAFNSEDWQLAERAALHRVERAERAGADEEETARLRIDHARALQFLGGHDEAERVLAGVLESADDQTRWSAVGALLTVGFRAMRHGSLQEAERCLTRAREGIGRWPEAPEADPTAPYAYLGEAGLLAALLHDAGFGDGSGAVEACRRSYDELHRRLPADHSYVLHAQVNLGTALLVESMSDGSETDVSQAVELLSHGLDKLEHGVGERHVFSLEARLVLAMAYMHQRRRSAATELLDSLIRRARGPGTDLSPQVLVAALSLRASCDFWGGRIRRGEETLAEAVRTADAWPDLPPDAAHMPRLILALRLLAARRFEETHAVMERAEEGLYPSLSADGTFRELGVFLARYRLHHRGARDTEETARRVHEGLARALPPGDVQRREAAYTLGEALAGQGRFEEAEPHFAEALRVDAEGRREPVGGEDPDREPGRARALLVRANAALALQRAGTAGLDVPGHVPQQRRRRAGREGRHLYTAYAMSRCDREMVQVDAASRPATPESQELLVRLGRGLLDDGELRAAERLLRSVVLVRDRSGRGDGTPREAASLLALSLRGQGKEDEALWWYRRELGALEDARAGDGAEAVRLRGEVADRKEAATRIRELDERLDRAVLASVSGPGPVDHGPVTEVEQEYREHYVRSLAELGDGHPITRTAAYGLGRCLAAQSRFAEAHTYFCAGLEIDPRTGRSRRRERYSWGTRAGALVVVVCLLPLHWLVFALVRALARTRPVLWTQPVRGNAKRYGKARGLRVWRSVLGPDNRWVAFLTADMGENAHAAGDLDSAERHLREAVLILEGADRSDPYLTALTTHKLASVLLDRGDHAEAAHWFLRVAPALDRVFGEEDRAVLGLRGGVLPLLLHAGDYVRAEEIALDLLPRVERVFAPGSAEDVFVRHWYGTVLRKTGRRDGAEEVLAAVVERARELRTEILPLALAQLGCVIHERGRPGKARPLLAEADTAFEEQGLEGPIVNLVRGYLAEGRPLV
ncbi:tetratricopeptide repeat protein [Nocardiopsis alborubida]|uniref:Tetratricopeptide repeat protein n=1 Tax=Nocardiopsis alborubida TaxID=146802 RepID=A0A7X6RSY7_9ACTN|nr:tetratricopeptide repeat protein [Nocardiopsis alborubida]NKZ00808.1 tetratricopeptide repeat protein [Nocardiopsis alborubida]